MARWTKEEDSVLLDQVTKRSFNLKEAFTNASRILETRTRGACAQRWYTYLSKQKDTVCFATVCYRGKNINRKNTCKEKNIKTLSWWNKIIQLIKG